jgi:DNA-binding MarR family transcriptional regulator
MVVQESPPSKLRQDPIAQARQNWIDIGWADSADGMALVTSITRVQQVVIQTIDELLRPFGLTFARFEVLMLLRFSRNGSLPLGKIGERLQVHPASVTNAVDRLEAAGLVSRTPNPSDRRSVLASISPSGRRTVEAAAGRLNSEVFANLPLDTPDIHTANAVLRRWRAAFGDFDTSHDDGV